MTATSSGQAKMQGHWLSAAARMIGCHPVTLRNACRRGEVRHGKIGNRILIASTEIQRLLGISVEPTAAVGPAA